MQTIDSTFPSFSFHQVDDFGPREQGMPLEMMNKRKKGGLRAHLHEGG
jgi:hypothetical protein